METINKLWHTIIYPFIMVWNSIFNNDAHKIVSNKGQEVLNKQKQKEILIDLMNLDNE